MPTVSETLPLCGVAPCKPGPGSSLFACCSLRIAADRTLHMSRLAQASILVLQLLHYQALAYS